MPKYRATVAAQPARLWRCPGCRQALGTLRGDTLVLGATLGALIWRLQVDRRGVVTLACRCGAVSVYNAGFAIMSPEVQKTCAD